MDESFDYIRRIVPETSTMFVVPAAVGPSITWNPADADVGTILSNGNLSLVGTNGGQLQGARATVGYSTGAYYFEINRTILGSDSFMISGILDNTTVAIINPGSQPNGAGVRRNQSFINGFTEDNATAFGGSDALNDVYMFAVDIDNKKVWRGLNGTWLGSVTPVVGAATQWAHWASVLTIFPGVGCLANTSPQGTLQAKTSSFSFSAPAGFSPWDPT